MTLDARAKIIVEAATDAARRDFERTAKSLAGIESAAGSAGRRVTSYLKDVVSTAGAVGAAFAGVGLAAKKLMDGFQQHAKAADDMARAIGTTTEESSRLIEVADDLAISQETLTMAMRTAIRRGVQPNIDGLARLSAEYNALKDPVQKSQFLLDKFGRSGLDMARMMDKGSDAIQQMARDVPRFLIVTADAAKKAEEWRLAQDELADAIKGVKFQLGGFLAEGLLPYVRIMRETPRIAADLTVRTLEWAATLPGATEAVKELALRMRENFDANTALVDSMGALEAPTLGAGKKLEKLAEIEERAAAAARQLTLNLEDVIEAQINLASFAAGGGGALLSVVQDITREYDAGNINLGEMRGLLEWSQLEALRIKATIGLIGWEEAQASARQLGLDLGAPAKSAEQIRRDLEALKDRTVTVTIRREFRTVGQGGGSSIGSGYQHGGELDPNRVALVGEAGPELILGGVVIPTSETKRLMALGLVPGKRLGTGGTVAESREEQSIGYGRTPVYKAGATPGKWSKEFAGEATAAEVFGGTAAGSTAIDRAAEAAAEAAVQPVIEAVTAEVGGLATNVAAQVAFGMARQTAALQEQIRASREVLDELRVITEVLRRQGTAGDVGAAVRDSIQMVAG